LIILRLEQRFGSFVTFGGIATFVGFATFIGGFTPPKLGNYLAYLMRQ